MDTYGLTTINGLQFEISERAIDHATGQVLYDPRDGYCAPDWDDWTGCFAEAIRARSALMQTFGSLS